MVRSLLYKGVAESIEIAMTLDRLPWSDPLTGSDTDVMLYLFPLYEVKRRFHDDADHRVNTVCQVVDKLLVCLVSY